MVLVSSIYLNYIIGISHGGYARWYGLSIQTVYILGVWSDYIIGKVCPPYHQ